MYSFAVLLAMMLVSTTAKAQFKGETTQGYYVGTTQITFDLASVAEAFGVSSETLIADLETFLAAEKATNATEADALGMKVQLIVNGGETVYPTDEIGYTAGYNGTYWMTKEGAAIAWGTEGFAWYAQWIVDQENVLFGFEIGKNADVWAEGGSATADLAWTYNEKTVNFELTLNVEAKPAVEPVETDWEIVKENLVEGVKVEITQKRRGGYDADQVEVAVPTLLSSLGFTAEDLVSLNEVLYAREYVDEYNSEADIHNYSYTGKITNEFTAGAPGFWFGPTYTWDEANEDNIPDYTNLVRFDYTDTDRFFAEGFSFLPAATSADVDSLVFRVGQMPNAASDDGEEYHATVYLMHGNVGFPVEIVLTIEKTEKSAFEDMEKMGETDVLVKLPAGEATTNTNYTVSNIEEILTLLEASASEVTYYGEASEGILSSLQTANSGGSWFNGDGYVIAYGDQRDCYIEFTGDKATWTIGTYLKNDHSAGDEINLKYYLIANTKYWQFNVTVKYAADENDYTTWEKVGTITMNVQTIAPTTGYEFTEKLDYIIPLDQVYELLGVNSFTLFGQKRVPAVTDPETGEVTTPETITWSNAYSCADPENHGFWMEDNGQYVSSWGNWGAGGSSWAFSMVYATGEIYMYNQPGTRQPGDSYRAIFYLADVNNQKYVELPVNVKFVETLTPTEVVGEKTVFLTWESADKNDGLNYNYVAIDDMVDALLEGDASLLQSCSWLVYKNGDYASTGAIYPEFNYYDTDGKYVGNEEDNPELFDTASFSVGFNIDEEAFSVSSLGKEEWDGEAKLVELAVEYEGKRYLLHVYAGTAEQIAELETGIDSIAADNNAKKQVFDLAGRRVSAPAKGLYIVNGKKVLVK